MRASGRTTDYGLGARLVEPTEIVREARGGRLLDQT